MTDIRDVNIIAPNFKRRLSGVTSTIIQLVPVQAALGQKVATLGPGLPASLPHIGFAALLRLWHPPRAKARRVWHARRNIEMLPALILRDLLRMPLKIVFTSASQRRHSGWTKFLVSRMDAVIATSARTAAYLDVESTTILHGIDTRRFSPPDDRAAAKKAVSLDPAKKVVGCFGRVRRQKGTDLFVDVMIAALPSRPDWIAIIAGRATPQHQAFETDLRNRIAKAGLTDRILFVGEHTDINRWYRALDLFIAPQRWEGFGLTPLEAMASGVPVIATDVGAFSELIVTGDAGTGRLIATDSLTEMQAAAAAYMDDGEAAAAAGQRGRSHVCAAFSIEDEARRIGAVYDRLLDAP